MQTETAECSFDRALGQRPISSSASFSEIRNQQPLLYCPLFVGVSTILPRELFRKRVQEYRPKNGKKRLKEFALYYHMTGFAESAQSASKSSILFFRLQRAKNIRRSQTTSKSYGFLECSIKTRSLDSRTCKYAITT